SGWQPDAEYPEISEAGPALCSGAVTQRRGNVAAATSASFQTADDVDDSCSLRPFADRGLERKLLVRARDRQLLLLLIRQQSELEHVTTPRVKSGKCL